MSHDAMSSPFNGGKMAHIFAFNDKSKRYETNGTFTSPESEQALLHGQLFYKIDGSNGMIQVISTKDDDNILLPTLKVYQRLDTKGKKQPEAEATPNDDCMNSVIPLPAGKNPSEYPGHSYYYTQISTSAAVVTGKKLIKRNRAMLDLVQRHVHTFVSMNQEWISIEWVGTMFNKTPNVPHAVAIAIHQHQRFDDHSKPPPITPPITTTETTETETTELSLETAAAAGAGGASVSVVDNNEKETTTTKNLPTNEIPSKTNKETNNNTNNNNNLPMERTYNGIRQYLLHDCAHEPIEGLIIEHEGMYWKIRTDCFSLLSSSSSSSKEMTSDPFKNNRTNARPPIFLV